MTSTYFSLQVDGRYDRFSAYVNFDLIGLLAITREHDLSFLTSQWLSFNFQLFP